MARVTETEDYIGDGVYVDVNQYGGIDVKANDNQYPTDTVVLEVDVMKNLVRYALKMNVLSEKDLRSLLPGD